MILDSSPALGFAAQISRPSLLSLQYLESTLTLASISSWGLTRLSQNS